MSAYICNPEHFAALAVYAVKRQAVIPDYVTDAAFIAGELAIENIRSVAYRYPNNKSGARPGPCMMDGEIIGAAHQFAQQYSEHCPQLSEVDLLAMLSCFDYQACETPDYSESKAAKQIKALRAKIMHGYPNLKPRDVPGYENAIRNFEDGKQSETLPPDPVVDAVKAAQKLADSAIERAVLLAKYSYLLKMSESKFSRYATAAKNIRAELKRAFPGVKFKVTSDSFSMGNSISIRWTDGPTVAQVEAISDKYQSGNFNGMEDIYEYQPSIFRELFGQSKYISCRQEYSDAFIELVIARLTFEYVSINGIPCPTVENYRKGNIHCTPWERVFNLALCDTAA